MASSPIISAKKIVEDWNEAKKKIPILQEKLDLAWSGTLLGSRAWKKKYGFPYNPNWVNGLLIPEQARAGANY